MRTIPRVVSVSDLRFKQTEVLDMLNDDPIIMTRGGHAVAVLIAPDAWNQIVTYIEECKERLEKTHQES